MCAHCRVSAARSGGVSSRRSKGSIKSSPPAATNYDPLEVINYYVIKEHEAELARNRVATPPPPPPPAVPEDELPHNTVVALPKINRCVQVFIYCYDANADTVI